VGWAWRLVGPYVVDSSPTIIETKIYLLVKDEIAVAVSS
jgi:hypothetical protein